MQKPTEENPRPWPDANHPKRAKAIAWIALGAAVICIVGFDLGRHLWAMLHR